EYGVGRIYPKTACVTCCITLLMTSVKNGGITGGYSGSNGYVVRLYGIKNTGFSYRWDVWIENGVGNKTNVHYHAMAKSA
ncbi:hypothetical protein, partial [Brenneria salicis]|uniref:hypothetical protein n=1 Tax=Brenneria salicis TaxID=55214 RepID=UPI001B882CDB